MEQSMREDSEESEDVHLSSCAGRLVRVAMLAFQKFSKALSHMVSGEPDQFHEHTGEGETSNHENRLFCLQCSTDLHLLFIPSLSFVPIVLSASFPLNSVHLNVTISQPNLIE